MDITTWNTITRALDNESIRLSKERVKLLLIATESQDKAFALEVNADAIRDTERAKIDVAREAGLWDEFIDHPADARWADS